MNGYQEFIANKTIVSPMCGLTVVPPLNPMLFEFQRDIVGWSLRKGRSAIFADCGLGKTPMQLEWAKAVPGPVLVLAPLAVAQQTVREGKKFGIDIRYDRAMCEICESQTITNYDMLERFAASRYAGVVLDESSILKSYDGAFRNLIIGTFSKTPYRLTCTATPAPNDYMELGNHAEFLGVMTRTEMLSTFFVHDGGDTSKWRVKKHAARDFWKWVCSWAVMIRKPSDLGYDDAGFILPPLHIEDIVLDVMKPTEGYLFALPANTLQERRQARSITVEERAAKVAELVAQKPDEPWLIWCNLNSESETAASLIPGAVEVTGSQSQAFKEAAALWFIGELCDCQLAIIGRRGKLAECGKPNMPMPAENAITQMSVSESAESLKDGIQSRIKNTCDSGSGETKTKSEHIDSDMLSDGASDHVNYTLRNQSAAPRPSQMLGNGGEITQRNISPNGSSPTALLPQNSERYSDSKKNHAPSVELNLLPVRISTTVTTQDASEGSCAEVATSLSDTSKTIRSALAGQRCTCGGIKPNRKLVSKGSIFGFGLNFQHCRNVAFLGLSDSWEGYYQMVRRCWRFGQKKAVNCYIVTSSQEGAVTENIKRKEKDAAKMAEEMVNNMHELNQQEVRGIRVADSSYSPSVTMDIPAWL